MKKTGIIALALVLALGSLGIGLAHWSQNLFVNTTVQTGHMSAEMFLAKNAIGYTYCGNPTSPPVEGTEYRDNPGVYVPLGWGGADDGNWDSPGQKDNNRNQGLGATCPAGPIYNWWGGDDLGYGRCGPDGTKIDAYAYLLGKHVGSTTITTDGTTPMPEGSSCAAAGSKTMHIKISNAYPGYVSGASFCVVNNGQLPIKVVGFSTPSGIPDNLIVAFLDYPFAFYDEEGNYIPGSAAWHQSTGGGGCYVFDGASTGLTIPDAFRQQLDEGECRLMGIYIEVKQAGTEQLKTYTFDIELLTNQYSAP